MNAPLTLTTRFGRHRATTAVTSLEDASRVFAELRDRHETPSSRAADGVVTDRDGRTVAIVTYNGRVWGPDGWRPGAMPLVEAQIAGSGR
jgi:hypothetical protein